MAMSAPTRIPLKLVLVGEGSVGKTCLLAAYKAGKYEEKQYTPTIHDEFTQNLSINNTDIELSIHDTAGQEGYEMLRPLSYTDANVFLVCYSVEHRDSYENVRNKWVPDLKRYSKTATLVLAALKTDLRTDYATLEELKRNNSAPVSTQEGQELAKEIGAIAFVECSARAMRGVENTFEEAVRAHLAAQNKSERKNKRNGCTLL